MPEPDELRPCPHCREQVSAAAQVCPSCKWRLPAVDRRGTVGTWLFRIGTAVLALGLLVNVALSVNVLSRIVGPGDANGILGAIVFLPVVLVAWPLFLLFYQGQLLPALLVYGGVVLGFYLRNLGDSMRYR